MVVWRESVFQGSLADFISVVGITSYITLERCLVYLINFRYSLRLMNGLLPEC